MIVHSQDTVWSVDRARRLAFLVDAADYFNELAQALRQAKNEIWIVGWDFNPDIPLCPGQEDVCRLSEIFQRELDAKPDLVIRILVWAMGPVYSGKSLRLFKRQGILSHERVHLEFAMRQPFWSSHHQKIVVIDDSIAFIGGIDLTARRWDDSNHRPTHPLRVSPDGKPYESVHDVQVMIDGSAARGISDIVRYRWRLAMNDQPRQRPVPTDQWPAHRTPDLEDCRIALALTQPDATSPMRRGQSTRLALNAIQAAQHHIYIEAQYLTSFSIADAMAKRLAEKDGPEIVVVTTRLCHGFLEKLVMGANRRRLIRRLKRVDSQDRLRVMYPVVPDENGKHHDVFIHSKLLIVDDSFIRIGSSNLNNRSEGLDTEADLAIEGHTAHERAAIARLRHRLLAEHLDSTPQEICETFESCGTLRETIYRHNVRARGLRPFAVDVAKGAIEPVAGTAIVDPARPVRPIATFRRRMQMMGTRLLSLLFYSLSGKSGKPFSRKDKR